MQASSKVLPTDVTSTGELAARLAMLQEENVQLHRRIKELEVLLGQHN